MGLERPKSESETEYIKAAAVRFGEELFTGRMHIEAICALKAAHPDWATSNQSIEEGFVTDGGRFVDREEAMRIAETAEQLEGAEFRSRGRELDSHDVKGFKELDADW